MAVEMVEEYAGEAGDAEDAEDAEEQMLLEDALAMRHRDLASLDETEAVLSETQQEILRAARLYSQEVHALNAERCTRDWMHCLLNNFTETNMDLQLQHIVAFLCHKYALTQGWQGDGPLVHEAETDYMNPISRQTRIFLEQTLAYVVRCRNVPIKQFLVLAVVAREPELQHALRLACPDQHIEDLLSVLPQLGEHLTNLPFNRINVAAYVTQFLRAAKDAYFKGATLPAASPSALNLQRSGKLSIESMGL